MRQGVRGVEGQRRRRSAVRGTVLESTAVERESRVPEGGTSRSWILSRAGPEKPCLKPAAPSAKAKYY